MRRWLLSFLFILMTCMGAAQTVRNFPSLETDNQFRGLNSFGRINSSFYVGQVTGVLPSIQSAVTAACATSGARVVIPAGSVPSDTIAAVTGGCSTTVITDQRTFPDGCFTWSGSAYTASSCGGVAALFPQLPNIVFSTSQSTSRNATFLDIFALFTGNCTGANVPQANGTCGPGGSASFPGLPNQQVFSAGLGAGAPSAATLDTAGNSMVASNGGTPDANIITASSPTSNNAISRSLQTPGNFATVNQAYPGTELTAFGLTIRQPQFLDGGYLFGAPTPNIAYNTGFVDYRKFNAGRVFYNPNDGATGTSLHDSFLKNDDKLGSNNQTTSVLPFADTYTQSCCGVAGGGQSNIVMLTHQFVDLARGISGFRHFEYGHYGIDDSHNIQVKTSCDGGAWAFSSEGCAALRLDTREDAQPFFGTVTNTLATGATVIPIVPGSSSKGPGEGRYALDVTQQGPQFHILTVNGASGVTPAYYTYDTTIPDDTFCQIGGFVPAISPQTKGLTTSVAVPLGNCSAAIVPGVVAIASHSSSGLQCVQVTSVITPFSGATETVQINLEGSVASNEFVMQGPHVCQMVELLANQTGSGIAQPYRSVVRAEGVSGGKLFFVAPAAGNWSTGPEGNFKIRRLSPGTTLTRDGSGNVCTGFGTDFSFQMKGTTIRVNSAVDTTYNGVFTIASVNPSVNICWSNAGTVGSTTTTGSVWWVASNGFDVSAAKMGPGFQIMEANNPSTKATDGTVLADANNLTIAAGDVISSSAGDSNILGTFHEVVSYVGFPNGSLAGGVSRETQINNPPDGYSIDDISLHANPKDYIGGGGFRLGINYRDTSKQTPVYHNYDFLSAPTTGGAIVHVTGCGLRLCTDPGAFYSPHIYDGAAGNYSETWNASTTALNTNVHTALGDTSVDSASRLYQVLVNDGGGNTNVFQLLPTSESLGKQLTVTDNVVTNPIVSKSNHSSGTCTDVLATNVGVEWGFCVGGAAGYVASNGTIPIGGVGVIDKTNNRLIWTSTNTLTTDAVPRALPTGSTMNALPLPGAGAAAAVNGIACFKQVTPTVILGQCSVLSGVTCTTCN